MKKTILAFAVIASIAGATITSCNSSAEKVENAEDNVIEATEDLDKANEEYLADVENYRVESNEKIAANDRAIAEFKANKKGETKEAKAEYDIKIAELEQKNSDMRMKLANYKTEGKENWEIFKSEFSRDMDELGNSFKDFTVENVR